MPATGVSKRKRASGAEGSAKKRRASTESQEDPNAKVLLMEQGILESKKNYNDISVLLTNAQAYEKGEPESMLSTVALCRIFVRLLAQGSLISKKSLSEKDAVVVAWLKDQFSQFKSLLLALLDVEEISTTALTLCMRTLKAEGEYLYDKEEYLFPRAFLEDIVTRLVLSESDELRQAFIEEFVEQYDDIRFHAFKSIKAILGEAEDNSVAPEIFDHAFAMLSVLDGVPESAEELEDFYVQKPTKKGHALLSVHQHKKQGQEAWMALFAIVETKDQRKRILDITSTVIAPWFTMPELLADFLTNCYNAGGSMSLLALSGVFYLIQERNLDYPSFYHKLYSLLNQDILHSKYRSRFFRLLDIFLASPLLPAALVASFVKRLSQLSLNAPPSAIATVIPWIYNLLKRHPQCTFMVHRKSKSAEAKQAIQDSGLEDPFLADEPNPMKTNALDSSLWELVQLQSHYHPNVATIAKILSEQFTKQAYNMEDFLDHSYASLLEAEMGKEVKKAPVVEFHIPKKIFLPQETPAAVPDSLIVKMWDFGGEVEAV